MVENIKSLLRHRKMLFHFKMGVMMSTVVCLGSREMLELNKKKEKENMEKVGRISLK